MDDDNFIATMDGEDCGILAKRQGALTIYRAHELIQKKRIHNNFSTVQQNITHRNRTNTVPPSLKISICLASYNGSKYISDQLNSILPQLKEEDEILVADDGSTDDTVNLIISLYDRIKIVASSRVGGVVKNFERVIQAASGDIIALCDQDDVWLPGRLEIIRINLQHATLLLMNGQLVYDNLRPTGQTIFQTLGKRRGFFQNLTKNSYIGCCMAFRKELLTRIIPFPQSVPWHDWYIGLVAELTGTVLRIDSETILYRRHGGNASPTGEGSENTIWKMFVLRIAVLWAVLVAIRRSGDLCK